MLMNEKMNQAYRKYVLQKDSRQVPLARTLAIDNVKRCTVDALTRVITIPEEYQIAGVMADNCTKRIYFKIPRYSQDVDLSTFDIFINYMNANGESDKYICEDKVIDDIYITFSWNVGEFATKYKGDIRFIICLINGAGEHWNTTLATIKVLEGLETTHAIIDADPDIFEYILRELSDISEKVNIDTITEKEINNLF